MAAEQRPFERFKERPGRDTARPVLESLQNRVYGICFQVLHMAPLAEEATRQVLFQAVETLRNIPDEKQLSRWLHKAALTAAIDLKRKRPATAGNLRPAEAVEKESRERIYQALTEIDEEHRTLIMGHYFEKRDLEELAREQGGSSVSVWEKISRGKERIKTSLAREGLTNPGAVELQLESMTRVQVPATLVTEALLSRLPTAAAAEPRPRGGAGWIPAAGTALVLGILVGMAVESFRARKGRESLQQKLAETEGRLAEARKELQQLKSRPVPAPVSKKAPTAPATIPPVRATVPAAEPERKPAASLADLLQPFVRVSGRPGMGGGLAPYAAVAHAPASDPERFAELAGAWTEAVLTESGEPVTDVQKPRLQALLNDLRSSLSSVTGLPQRNQLIGELQAESRWTQGLASMLSDTQRKAALDRPVEDLLDRKELEVTRGNAAEKLAGLWIAAYGLDESQRPAAEAVAKSCASTLVRLADEFRVRQGNNTPDPQALYEHRLQMLRAQLEEMSFLENTLSPQQRERMMGSRLTEVSPADRD